jgi:hypothetical protein
MRQFLDEHGVEWTTYQVVRQARPKSPMGTDILPRTYANGWLVFESASEKRRLAPFPRNWDELPDATLRSLLGVAIPPRPSGGVNAQRFEDALRNEEQSSSDNQ